MKSNNNPDQNIPEMNISGEYKKPIIPENTEKIKKGMEKTKKALEKLKTFVVKKYGYLKPFMVKIYVWSDLKSISYYFFKKIQNN